MENRVLGCAAVPALVGIWGIMGVLYANRDQAPRTGIWRIGTTAIAGPEVILRACSPLL